MYYLYWPTIPRYLAKSNKDPTQFQKTEMVTFNSNIVDEVEIKLSD